MNGPVVPDAIREPVNVDEDSRGALGREVMFVRLWALANLSHILIQWGGKLEPTTALNLVVAVVVLGYARSARALTLLAFVQVVDTAVLMPNTPDHQYLAALVNLAVLVAFVRGRPRSSAALVDAVAPTARWVLLIAYSAAVIAKYNYDFLDAALSCAAFVGHTASFGAISMDSMLAHVFVIGTIVGETLVATLLIIPRTRAWGVVFGISFHYLVSLSPAISVGDFSTTLWALFLLFLSPVNRAALYERVSDGSQVASTSRGLSRIPRPVVVTIAATVVLLVALSDLSSAVAVWLFTTAFGPWLAINVALTLRRRIRPAAARIGQPHRSQFLSLVLVVLLAVSPYVGMGTSSRFTMFSSLRTEGPGTNHLFMPSFHIDQVQNEYLVVERVYGSSDTLERAREERAAMPTVEVRRILANRSRGGVFVTSAGERIEVLPNTDHELRDQAPWWRRKTQHYRSFRLDDVTVNEFCSN